ncbi:YIP1 family protein [Mangrovicoccus algicola]|uniref:YIP1 family protein n=1 Tax=Mangrovicoccus algicola TaxID=2771008 RepID=A0A8J6YWU4_9RHOB|nr:YIP1 family protein [Mangrovicoccus algicola]MBE3637729.1 YIP1 family protein [Mangrovicoccus algicola]
MGLLPDIAASYRRPGRVVRRRLDAPAAEGRALAWLLLGCALVYVAQLPRLAREAALSGQGDLAGQAAAELVLWLFFAPLVFYGLAALSCVVARLAGWRPGWYGARVAAFWAFLAAAPLWLARGLVAVLAGPGPVLDAVTAAALAGWLVIWALSLRAAAMRIAGPGGLA